MCGPVSLVAPQRVDHARVPTGARAIGMLYSTLWIVVYMHLRTDAKLVRATVSTVTGSNRTRIPAAVPDGRMDSSDIASSPVKPMPQSRRRNASDCPWLDHPLYGIYPSVNKSQSQTSACLRMMTDLSKAEAYCHDSSPVKLVFTKGIALGAFRHASLAPGDNDVDAYVLYSSESHRQASVNCLLSALAKLHPHVHNWNAQYRYYGIESRVGTCNADLIFELEGTHTGKSDICWAPVYGVSYKFRKDVPVALESFYGKSVYYWLPTHLKDRPRADTCAYILQATDADGDGQVSAAEIVRHYRSAGVHDAADRVVDSSLAGAIGHAVSSMCSTTSSERLH